MEIILQQQYDLIYSFFKKTTELFDDLDWNGESLSVLFEDRIIEVYYYNELCEIIENF